MADVFVITSETKPSFDEVLKDLRDGKYTCTAHKYSLGDLSSQLMQLTPSVHEQCELFKQNDYEDTPILLVACHRFLEIAGGASAEQVSRSAETVQATAAQTEPRYILITSRDALQDLARDQKVPTEYFAVNFPDGDASRLLVPAMTLDKLIEQHGQALKKPKLVGAIHQDVKGATAQLKTQEIKQETGKVNQKIPTAEKTRASQALYEGLLSLSRRGRAINRRNPEMVARYSLSVLFGNSGKAEPEEPSDPT